MLADAHMACPRACKGMGDRLMVMLMGAAVSPGNEGQAPAKNPTMAYRRTQVAAHERMYGVANFTAGAAG